MKSRDKQKKKATPARIFLLFLCVTTPLLRTWCLLTLQSWHYQLPQKNQPSHCLTISFSFYTVTSTTIVSLVMSFHEKFHPTYISWQVVSPLSACSLKLWNIYLLLRSQFLFSFYIDDPYWQANFPFLKEVSSTKQNFGQMTTYEPTSCWICLAISIP